MKATPVIMRTTDLPLQRNEMLALGHRGKLGWSTGLGFMTLGRARLGDTSDVGGIWRKANTGYNQYGYSPNKRRKTIYVLMRTYAGVNPQTPEQQAHRGTFRDAVAAWQSLTDAEKHNYTALGAERQLPGYQFFISQYLKSH